MKRQREDGDHGRDNFKKSNYPVSDNDTGFDDIEFDMDMDFDDFDLDEEGYTHTTDTHNSFDFFTDSDNVVYDQGHTMFNTILSRVNPIRHQTSKSKWTTEETDKFYDVLSVCGEDFTLMNTFFPNKTRKELLNKYKTEGKKNPQILDDVIKNPQPLSMFYVIV
eukprot:TRINITY_DN6846_c0_g1_i2.p1 TRINITY_DN6846_c0_g1~~TRINITY_DN6846_c0_g1_i2.p1  ORF type:complete len:164 (-),score=43.04 TRINITY_DN6846_c0_g1_i2:392-883(-)